MVPWDGRGVNTASGALARIDGATVGRNDGAAVAATVGSGAGAFASSGSVASNGEFGASPTTVFQGMTRYASCVPMYSRGTGISIVAHTRGACRGAGAVAFPSVLLTSPSGQLSDLRIRGFSRDLPFSKKTKTPNSAARGGGAGRRGVRVGRGAGPCRTVYDADGRARQTGGDRVECTRHATRYVRYVRG